jgi:PTS system nitrogen regulatory IIA component
MRVVDILTAERVSVAGATEGEVRSKSEALARLGALLARGHAKAPASEIEAILADRERLQSTGVGGGVAIPHGVLDKLDAQIGAVLLCPRGIDFDAIDHEPVTILFAVMGPKKATGEHLKTLARVSRLLRLEDFRARLLAQPSGAAAFDLLRAEDARGA